MMFVFFNDTATTEIYTLSLHDALPIFARGKFRDIRWMTATPNGTVYLIDAVDLVQVAPNGADRKSTRLNSSHVEISYAVFCLKKKKSTIFYEFCLWFLLTDGVSN